MTVPPALSAEPSALVRRSARVATVAQLLDCDESDVRRMVREGQLQAHGKGVRGIRVYLDSVRAYQDAREIVPTGSKTRLRAQRSSVSRAAHGAAEAALRKSGILP